MATSFHIGPIVENREQDQLEGERTWEVAEIATIMISLLQANPTLIIQFQMDAEGNLLMRVEDPQLRQLRQLR